MWCNHSLKCASLREYFQLQKKIKCIAFINVMLHISSDRPKKKRKERQKRNWKASEASIETDKCITIVLLKYEHQMAWGCDWWLELDNYCKLSLNPWGLRETVIWSMNLLSMTPMQSTFFSRIVGYKEYFLRAKPRGEAEKKILNFPNDRKF